MILSPFGGTPESTPESRGRGIAVSRRPITRQCKIWGLCESLGIANAHIHGNVLQNLNYNLMAAVDLNEIYTIQRCSFRIPSHITEHAMALHFPVHDAKMRP